MTYEIEVKLSYAVTDSASGFKDESLKLGHF